MDKYYKCFYCGRILTGEDVLFSKGVSKCEKCREKYSEVRGDK